MHRKEKHCSITKYKNELNITADILLADVFIFLVVCSGDDHFCKHEAGS